MAIFFKFSRLGLALRAAAFDQEAALAQGIPVGRMFGISWAISGALAAIAGMLVGTGGAGIDQNTAIMALFLVALVFLPFGLSAELNALMATAFISAIGAIGLNIVTGYAGQVSLGHAFFLGLGAYTAAVLSGPTDRNVVGFDLDMWIWLPAAGLLPAAVGLLIAPVAARLKGLYLAIVTLGLVFLGEHLFREVRFVTGGPGTGRSAARLELFGMRLDDPSYIGGTLEVTREMKLYFIGLVLLV